MYLSLAEMSFPHSLEQDTFIFNLDDLKFFYICLTIAYFFYVMLFSNDVFYDEHIDNLKQSRRILDDLKQLKIQSEEEHKVYDTAIVTLKSKNSHKILVSTEKFYITPTGKKLHKSPFSKYLKDSDIMKEVCFTEDQVKILNQLGCICQDDKEYRAQFI